ncbi:MULTISPECIES: non-ribosomal peptide synthetase [Micromonospora]|uniref:Amino acid adenylation domain-containing protein n=1 Tax=Micromonospora solifontis TaxID=2487138 RepID=A0ABX9WKS5_9ACTN|nr:MULTISPECIES: non-ribosomal peptide synthetase [Micromonospora]NES13760.1 amino acid adenylation domain-containing protein [Micromonospora sp. PPF5-17B]NES35551.1 amino acid adenylation domain-containing protein [Micromonospora solifontis]NES55963.1 amino acid adenylation domain-containing protein [Micromonospora sp. PPF5-6]RNM00605.1 amino acid adenylation domain-containing protein [Micromonospora solifontis]
MTDLDARLAALSPEKRALFAKLLRERGQAPPDRGEQVFPISVMQQGIWFLEQLRPGNPAYLIPAAVRIRGPLDTALLRQAVNGIVARHESLRTTFELRDGRPVQVVRPALEIALPEVDLGGTAFDGDELADRVAAALREPFELTTGPLLRLVLLRLGADDCVLGVAMHHLVSDGWSVGVLLGELSTRYAALVAGERPDLPELRVQYGDYAVWQRDWLSREDLAADLVWWRRHLAGAPAVLDLPTDRPRPAVQGFRGAAHPFELAEPVLSALGGLGKRHGATTYMALLAVFGVLLRRYSGQDDVVIGVPMANRDRAEVEPLIGFFVNTLPVRVDLTGDPGFAELLHRVRDACLGGYAHQRVPFEKVVEALKPARDLSRPPVFQVGLSYQSDPLPTLALAGVEFERLPLRAEGARFDLELQFFNRGGGLSGWFEYDRDLFEDSTIARLAEHFRRLVELVIDRPDTPIDELALLDADERRQVLALSRGEDRWWPGTGWVHEQIVAQARRTPALPALRFADRTVSYGELLSRANGLARRLRGAGVGPGVLVGLVLERSVELVVSLLAIWQAGGAYVPIDPELPARRVALMLGDADPAVVLTQRALAGRLSWDGPLWYADELLDQPTDPVDDGPATPVRGADVAYVIYTSGSTGQPKGVPNTFAGIRNRLLWMQDTYRLGPDDRVLQKTPYSFDVSVWEFFWPLMTGATLVVARPGGHRDGRYLVETIRAEQVTTVHFVPSMLQAFLREPDVADCTSLRRVICSGEALSPELRDRFFARSGAELHNLYGPTEAAIDVTAWACRREDPGPVPIGRPIANTQVYVLDRFLAPVPPGVPGELHIGGVNVALGYLNRPELTAERFVPDPFAADWPSTGPAAGAASTDGPAEDRDADRPPARLYRTGDLGRIRIDGAIEYLGRLDHQVKLRGFRIELGEIEAALTACDGVGEAVVVPWTHAGDVRLVAYLVGPAVPDTGELVARLRERLPEYMVPSAFTTLSTLPLTPNGKVDRRALPEPDLARPQPGSPYVAPRNQLERTIAGIWRELLGVDQIGVDDNFFELGGHSLLMAEARARLAEAAGRDVTLVELFQFPTVGALAGYLDRPGATADLLAGAEDRAGHRRQSLNRRQQAAARRSRA